MARSSYLASLPQERRDLARLQEQAERESDAVMSDLADEVSRLMRSIAREGEAMTIADLNIISPGLNRALAKAYGPRRGSPGKLEKMVHASRARAVGVVFFRLMDRLTKVIERDPILLATIEQETRVRLRRR